VSTAVTDAAVTDNGGQDVPGGEDTAAPDTTTGPEVVLPDTASPDTAAPDVIEIVPDAMEVVPDAGPSPNPTFAVLEIADDPNNPTLAPCDKGELKSPGSDIDGAELRKGGTGGGIYLTNCVLAGTSSCDNTADNASDAEGAPDASGSEETGTYVALNGGMLRCSWDGGAAAESGDVINVIEIGGSGGTAVEQYQVRLCAATAGNCTIDSTYVSGEAYFAVDDLF